MQHGSGTSSDSGSNKSVTQKSKKLKANFLGNNAASIIAKVYFLRTFCCLKPVLSKSDTEQEPELEPEPEPKLFQRRNRNRNHNRNKSQHCYKE